MKKLTLFLLSISLLIFSGCNLKKSKVVTNGTEENQKSAITETVSELVPERSFDFDWDDSSFDTEAVAEFSLKDEKGRLFCIVHNIRKVPEWNTKEYMEYGDIWVKQDIENLHLIWVYETGSILAMKTEDSTYSTARGIKVGDSIEKAFEVYKDSGEIYEWNDSIENYVQVNTPNQNLLYKIIKGGQNLVIKSYDLIDGKKFYILFEVDEGIISRIEISCLEFGYIY